MSMVEWHNRGGSYCLEIQFMVKEFPALLVCFSPKGLISSSKYTKKTTEKFILSENVHVSGWKYPSWSRRNGPKESQEKEKEEWTQRFQKYVQCHHLHFLSFTSGQNYLPLVHFLKWKIDFFSLTYKYSESVGHLFNGFH